MRNRVIQHHAIFYQLYLAREKDPQAYTPIWKLIGEVYVPEMAKWAFVSYEVSARMSELFKANPNLFDRQLTTGKSGSRYYEYRIRNGVTIEDIRDEKLLDFYKKMKLKRDILKRAPKDSVA